MVTVVEVWKIHDEEVLAVVELRFPPCAFVGIQSPCNPCAVILDQPKLIKQMDQSLVPIGLDAFQHVFERRLIQSAGACDLRLVLVELDLDVRPDEIVRVAEGKKNGRSYIFGDNDTAQELVDNYSGKGEVKKENTESVTTDKIVGVYKDIDGNEIESNEIIIVTSKTGAHVYPGFPKKKGNK